MSLRRTGLAGLLALSLLVVGSARPTAAPATTGAIPDTSGLSIFAGGDIQFDGAPGAAAATQGYDYPLALIASLTAAADLRIANLECALATSGAPVADKKYTFRADPALVAALQGRLDVLSLANNHVLDYGPAAFTETRERLASAGLLTVGAGDDRAAAVRPLSLEVNGLRVAIVAGGDLFPVPVALRDSWAAGDDRPGIATADWETLVPAVTAAARDADIVIAVLHWGYEYIATPAAGQVALARRLIDAGADLIIGSHPHVVQPLEVYKGRLITYSLGNFIMEPGRPAANDALAVNVSLNNDGSLRRALVTPLRYDAGRPRPATVAEAGELAGRLRAALGNADVASDVANPVAFSVVPR